MIAGVPPIGLVIDGKVQVYKRKYGLGSSDMVCDTPLPVHEWPHPSLQATITETNEATTYPTEIYTAEIYRVSHELRSLLRESVP